MCLVRIDYDGKRPEGEHEAWKVFKLYCDGRMTTAYRDKFTQVPIGEWQAAPDQPMYIASSKWRRNAFTYAAGFHASVKRYAEALAEHLNRSHKLKAEQGRINQLSAVQPHHYRDYDGTEHTYWVDSRRSPLEVTVQDPCYTFVVRRVILRGVHTVGRQVLGGKTYRTWIASEQLIPAEAN